MTKRFFFILLALGVYHLLSQSEAGFSAVLAFVPPGGRSVARTPPDVPSQDLAGWSSPAENARLALESAEFPEQLAKQLEAKPNLKALGPDSFGLLEQGRLRCRLLSPTLLEVRIFEKKRELAKAYTLATVSWLEKTLEQQKTSAEHNPALDSDFYRAREELASEEESLGGMVSRPERLPMLQFSLNHYREAVEHWRKASGQREKWAENIALNSPEFVILSGPSPFAQPKFLSKSASAGISLSVLLAGALFGTGRTRS